MAKNYKPITLNKRVLILAHLHQGFSPSVIAEGLIHHRSLIARALARNGRVPTPHVRSVGRASIAGGYSFCQSNIQADKLAALTRVEPTLVVGNTRWVHVMDGSRQGVSPEESAGTMSRLNKPIKLCREIFYQAIYAMLKGKLRTEIIDSLRCDHNMRRPRARECDRRGQIPNMKSINQHSTDIVERLVNGHGECVHIQAVANRSQMGALVERKTRLVLLLQLLNGREQVATEGISSKLQRFDVAVRRYLSYDQGREMAQHAILAENTGIAVYCAHPRSSLERGQNKNTKALLRQELPKDYAFPAFAQQDTDDIAGKFNARPKKSLAWECPAELFLPDGAFDFKAYWAYKLNLVALGH